MIIAFYFICAIVISACVGIIVGIEAKANKPQTDRWYAERAGRYVEDGEDYR